MRIDFVVKGSLQEWKNAVRAGEEGLILMGFDTVGEISYERELKGQSVCFEEIYDPASGDRDISCCRPGKYSHP